MDGVTRAQLGSRDGILNSQTAITVNSHALRCTQLESGVILAATL